MRRGPARLGEARHGLVKHGSAWISFPGSLKIRNHNQARRGEARPGMARQDEAGQGMGDFIPIKQKR